MVRLQAAASAAADRVVDTLGTAALHADSNARRQALMDAQYTLSRKLALFKSTFSQVLRRKVEQSSQPAKSPLDAAKTDWSALSLVDVAEDEERVSADRLALEVGHACEGELRELDGYMARLQGLEAVAPDENPLRPELIGQALFRGIEATGNEPEPTAIAGSAPQPGHGRRDEGVLPGHH